MGTKQLCLEKPPVCLLALSLRKNLKQLHELSDHESRRLTSESRTKDTVREDA